MEKGTILSGTWGATMTIPEFYRVISSTPKTFLVEKLGKAMLPNNCHGQQGYEVPNMEVVEGTFKGRLTPYGMVVTDEYKTKVYVDEWNGKPVFADYMD